MIYRIIGWYDMTWHDITWHDFCISFTMIIHHHHWRSILTPSILSPRSTHSYYTGPWLGRMDCWFHWVPPSDTFHSTGYRIFSPFVYGRIPHCRGYFQHSSSIKLSSQDIWRNWSAQGQGHGCILREIDYSILGVRELLVPCIRMVQILQSLQGM